MVTICRQHPAPKAAHGHFLLTFAFFNIFQLKDFPKKHIAILGSTGSIGTQALEVIRSQSENFEVEVLAANGNAELLIRQALEFNPNCVVIADKKKYRQVAEALQPKDIKVFAGEESLAEVVQMENIDIVLAAIVGYAGLKSTLSAIEAGKQIALANKETLVVAGELVTKKAKDKGVNIYPVDSEHSAIFQCLAGEFHNKIEKIYLTASGGPFRGKTLKELARVTKEQALKHPNWDMGAKITIDSATMMNKGLEVIEAHWLFNLEPGQIEVIIHPQSIIHSLVQFTDGSMKAQMGLPDMKLPIQYALSYPLRLKSGFPRFDFTRYPALTFEQPDTKTFRNLALAYEALGKGGNMPCALNAANEIAVDAFLKDVIGFPEIPDVIETVISKAQFIKQPSYDDYVNTDRETRIIALAEIDSIMRKLRIDSNAANNHINKDLLQDYEFKPQKNSTGNIIQKELSYRITGLLFKVQKELGLYALEKQYADLFESLLIKEKIDFNREKVVSKTNLDKNKPDFIINNSMVIDFKAKTFITKNDYYQIKRYLEILNIKLGILVNFRQKYLKPKRILNSKINL